MHRYVPALTCMLGLAPAIPVLGGSGAVYNAVPLRSVFNDDVRVLWFGDSFSVGASWRVSGASLMTWPFTSEMTGFTTGENRGTAVVFSTELDPGLARIRGANLWRLYQTGPEAELDLRFALPTWEAREYYIEGSGEPAVDLVRYEGRTILNGGSLGRVFDPGDTFRVRPMFLQGQAGIPAAPRMYRSDTDEILIDPETPGPGDGRIGTFPRPLDVEADADGLYAFTLSAPPASGRGYIQTNGFTLWEVDESRHRKPGLAWGYLADSSWSYRDFGRDTPAQTGVFSKTFSREQLADWFVATTLDTTRPVFVFYYFDVEDKPFDVARDHIRDMVEQTEDAAADAGVHAVHHCFVVPHMHLVSGLGFEPAQFGIITDAAVAVAQARSDMSVISIFDAMNGVFLNGSPEARAWLLANGHDHFVFGNRSIDYLSEEIGGDLLDAPRLHPNSEVDGALLYAWYAGRAIVNACPADFDAPYGVLDLADISAFVSLFVDGAYAADLVAPQGLLDLSYLSAFVSSFTAGCAE
jgi:hypothetical protein